MADREFPTTGTTWSEQWGNRTAADEGRGHVTFTTMLRDRCVLTVEFGLGQDAATEAEPVLPVADVEG